MTCTDDHTDSYEIEICTDCACWWANGDTTGIDDEAREEEVRAAVGIDDGYTVAISYGESFFSMNRCDSCRSPLGGDRVDAWMIGAGR